MLSDTKQRLIYDKLGWEGIKANWQLISHDATLEELRKLIRAQNEEWSTSTRYDLALDASLWSDRTVSLEEMNSIEDWMPRIQSFGVTQRFERRIQKGGAAASSIAAQISLLTRYGQGGKVLTLEARHEIGRGAALLEVELGLLGRRFAEMIVRRPSVVIGKRFEFGLGMRFEGNHIKHFIEVRSHLKPNTAMTLRATVPDKNVSCSLQHNATSIHATEQELSLKHGVFVDERNTVVLFASTGNVRAGLELIHTLDQEKSLHLLISSSQEHGGIVSSVLYRTTDWELHIPIKISENMADAPAFMYGALIPSLLLAGLKYAYSKFTKPQIDENELKRQREEAADIQEMLKPTHQSRIDASELKIQQAVLEGDLDFLDVTIPLQFQVREDRLIVAAGIRWAHLLGFSELRGVHGKRLLILYRFREQLHRAIFYEGDPVILPQRHHQIVE